jgi:hypothetical protein
VDRLLVDSSSQAELQGRTRWRRSQQAGRRRKTRGRVTQAGADCSSDVRWCWRGSIAGVDGQAEMQGRLRRRGGWPVDTSKGAAKRMSRSVRRLLSSSPLARTRGKWLVR